VEENVACMATEFVLNGISTHVEDCHSELDRQTALCLHSHHYQSTSLEHSASDGGSFMVDLAISSFLECGRRDRFATL